ncbi:MAG: sugar phosphate isomerase/epimerase family protein [Acidobacteriota bacterium]
MDASQLSRREFLQAASLGAAVTALPRTLGADPAPPRWKIITFSKPFIHLNFEDTADLVADVGWDGIECPVRKTFTHIDPARVEDQLPKMVEALGKRGRDVAMITTDITSVTPEAERILRTAAQLGIRRYRLGPIYYVPDTPIPRQLDEIAVRIRDLAQFNRTLKIQGAIQNHSGKNYFAAPVWDAFEVLRALPPEDMGFAFDIGHATLEGGLSWPIQVRLAAPRYSVVYVKDFHWEKKAGGWEPEWCALGEGMVSPTFFRMLEQSGYSGPVCQHNEYDMGKTPAEHLRHYKADLKTLRGWLAGDQAR